MTTEIIPLMFDNELIRMAADESKSALIAADICRAIGIRNTAQALEPLDEDEKGICITYTLGGPQELLTVTEGGAYTLVLRSRAAMTPGTRAYAFRKWLTAEALPALRRTGRYAMPGLDTRRPVSLNRMTALWDRVAKSTDPAERAFNYEILCRENEYHRLPVPELAKIGTEAPPPVDLIAALFDGLDQLTTLGVPWNHSRNPEVDAFVPAEINDKFREAGIDFVIDNHIREISRLPSSGITKKPVNSALGNRILHCWVIRSRLQHQLDI